MAVLTDEGYLARKLYKRKWNAEHRQHIRDYNARYWNAKGEQLKAVEQQQELKNIKMKEV